MTQEEKAKRYDEALEELRGLLEGIREEKCKILEEDITSIFPELQENEDERIRKELIFYLGDMPEDTELRNGVTNRDVLVWLEKQGEQKPAMIQWKGNNLKEVIDFTGIYKDGFEKWFHNSWEEYEKYVHEHNNIFKIFNKDGSHIEVPVGAWIVKTPDGYNTASRYVFRQKPAWSEEDEYWSERLLGWLNTLINYIHYDSMVSLDLRRERIQQVEQIKTLLNSIKDRVGCEANCTTTKKWSEEDIATISRVISIVKWAAYSDHSHPILNDEGATELVERLKSLKERYTWKPSDEHDVLIERAIKWLMDNIQDYTDDGMGEHSFVLVQDLKEDFKNYMKGE